MLPGRTYPHPEWRRFSSRLGLVLISLLYLVAPQAPAGTTEDAQSHAKRGIALAQAHDWATAEVELHRATQAAPRVALYHAQLGSILGLEGKWRESLASFQRAVQLEPASINFRREAAAVQWQLGLAGDAEKNLTYVLAKAPGDPGATLLLGLVSDAKGDYEAAVRLLDSQYELAVAQPDRALILCHASYASRQAVSAETVGTGRLIDTFRQRKDDPAWADAIARCTGMAAAAGNLRDAESLFVLIPDGDRRTAGFQLAALRYRGGQAAQAQELLSELVQQGWVDADAQTLLGNCFESMYQPGRAIAAYQKAIEIDPSQVGRYQDLIELELELGKTDDAIALAKTVVGAHPGDAKAWVLKGDVSLRMNAYKDALESYTRASKLDSSNADAVLDIAGVHFLAGDTDAAIGEYKSGMSRFPRDARFYVACAETLLDAPEPGDSQVYAESLLKKAVALNPQSAEAHYRLGQLALQQGQLTNAESELSTSLLCGPDRSKVHFALSAVYRRMGRPDQAASQYAIYQQLKVTEDGETKAATGNKP